MKGILFSVSLFAALAVQGQVTFQKTFGGASSDLTRFVQQVSGGGYFLGGQTFSYGAGQSDCFLIKTNAIGDTLWTVVVGTAFDERISSVQQTADGGYVFAGTINAVTAANDYYVGKLSSTGAPLWIKTYGGSEDDVEPFVLQTADGGYIVTGTTASYSGNPVQADIAYIRLDASGSLLSSHVIDVTGNNKVCDFQKTADSGYILLADAIKLIKLDSSGTVVWSRKISAASTLVGTSVRQTSDGGYIITGSINHTSVGTGKDVLLIKANASGDIVWTKAYGGGADEEAISVGRTTDAGYITAGWSLSFGAGSADGYLIKTNATGDTLWTQMLGGTGNDQLYSIIQTTDGGYIMTGLTTSTGAGLADSYLIKTDATGNSGCYDSNNFTELYSSVITDSAVTAQVYPFTFDVGSVASFVTRGCQKSTMCFVTGIASETGNDENNNSVYPNPFTNTVTIRADINASVTLFDYTGKEILCTKVNGEETVVNTGGLAVGLYFLRVEDGRGVRNYKIVKQ